MGRGRRSDPAPPVSSRSEPATADRVHGKTAALVALVCFILLSNASGTGTKDGEGPGSWQQNEHGDGLLAQEGELVEPVTSDPVQGGLMQTGTIAQAQELHEQIGRNNSSRDEEFVQPAEAEGSTRKDLLLQVQENMVEVGEEAADRTRDGSQNLELETVKATRVSPASLDEYRKKSSLDLQKSPICGEGEGGGIQVQHRLEPSGEKYNFAAASHGAKLVAANKEAKGASSILQKDKEKYYRSPCSAEDKFVVIELSEETLADMFVVANFEFYSSNLKEFELLGSLLYPTEDWISLGRFEAENARQLHSFRLPKPEWIRYLKLRMLSHYGSEFYCTLSMVEVYGIDAIECLLEEWLGRTKSAHQQDPFNSTTVRDGDCRQMEDANDIVQVSRLGDSVLKVLMQKVKALEFNQSLFERYVEELGSNYGALLGEFDQDLAVLKESLRGISSSISSLVAVLSSMKQDHDAKWLLLQSELSKHSDVEAAYLDSLRAQMHHMENRETVAVTLALLLILASSLSHILARCFPGYELSGLRFILFWSGCLIATVLFV